MSEVEESRPDAVAEPAAAPAPAVTVPQTDEPHADVDKVDEEETEPAAPSPPPSPPPADDVDKAVEPDTAADVAVCKPDDKADSKADDKADDDAKADRAEGDKGDEQTKIENDENKQPSSTADAPPASPPPMPPPMPPPQHAVTAADVLSKGATSHAPANIMPELLVKHPLQYRWVLWYCKHDRTRAWEECLKEVTAFDTVEDFWALYNHIQLASGLSWNSDYYLFKEGIKPMWEDEHNVSGGRWLVRVDKNRRLELLDQYWLELLMAMLGEQFDELGRHICGAVVNVRSKGDKVSLWTTDATSDEANKRIGQILKSKLHLTDPIVYEIHKETSVKQSSSIRPKLTL